MGKSSKDKRDAYYRLAKEQSWRARSAFKLIQLDEEFDLFSGCTRVVDLCAAPGSWSQVLSRVLVKGEKFGRTAWIEKRAREDRIIRGSDEGGECEGLSADVSNEKGTHSKSEETAAKQDDPSRHVQEDSAAQSEAQSPSVKIVAIDLQPMSPLDGITMLQGDITDPSTIPRILTALDASPSEPQSAQPVDLVLSDGAPDVTGLHDLDIHIQSSLLTSALDLTLRILRPGTGKFVAKIFRSRESSSQFLYSQLRCFFTKVTVAKPRASRASSLEAFVVCEGFLGVPKGFILGDLGRGGGEGIVLKRAEEDGNNKDEDENEKKGEKTKQHEKREDDWIPSFVACGDLSSWDDADATTHLPKDYVSLDPVQPPTDPPYKKALELRRQRGGLYGRTSKPQPKSVRQAENVSLDTKQSPDSTVKQTIESDEK